MRGFVRFGKSLILAGHEIGNQSRLAKAFPSESFLFIDPAIRPFDYPPIDPCILEFLSSNE